MGRIPSAMSLVDAYAALGLPYGTSKAIVKATYRQMALQWHPDRFPATAYSAEHIAATAARFRHARAAYDVIAAAGFPVAKAQPSSSSPSSSSSSSSSPPPPGTSPPSPEDAQWAAYVQGNANAWRHEANQARRNQARAQQAASAPNHGYVRMDDYLRTAPPRASAPEPSAAAKPASDDRTWWRLFWFAIFFALFGE